MKFGKAKETQLKMMSSKEFLQRILEEDPSMVKNLPILQKINAKGYLTIESQAGRKSNGKSVKTGLAFVMHERAYLSGFMPTVLAEMFVKKFNLSSSLCAVHVPSCHELDVNAKLDLPITYHTDRNGSFVDTHMSMAIPKQVEMQWKKQLHIDKTEKTSQIFCYDPEWNRPAFSSNGLFTKVFKVLQSLTE